VPIAEKPEDIVIVVMGGTGTHSLSVQTRLASENVTVPIQCKDGTPGYESVSRPPWACERLAASGCSLWEPALPRAAARPSGVSRSARSGSSSASRQGAAPISSPG
jgi:hypothetical protein